MYVEIIRMKPEKGIISRNQEDTSVKGIKSSFGRRFLVFPSPLY